MTGYVATRWYRAPEIMLNWMRYNQTGETLSLTNCLTVLCGNPFYPIFNFLLLLFGFDQWIYGQLVALWQNY